MVRGGRVWLPRHENDCPGRSGAVEELLMRHERRSHVRGRHLHDLRHYVATLPQLAAFDILVHSCCVQVVDLLELRIFRRPLRERCASHFSRLCVCSNPFHACACGQRKPWSASLPSRFPGSHGGGRRGGLSWRTMACSLLRGCATDKRSAWSWKLSCPRHAYETHAFVRCLLSRSIKWVNDCLTCIRNGPTFSASLQHCHHFCLTGLSAFFLDRMRTAQHTKKTLHVCAHFA